MTTHKIDIENDWLEFCYNGKSLLGISASEAWHDMGYFPRDIDE